MSKKRFLSEKEECVMTEVSANLATLGRFVSEYRNPTMWTARHIRALVFDLEEDLTNLVKGNYRNGRHDGEKS